MTFFRPSLCFRWFRLKTCEVSGATDGGADVQFKSTAPSQPSRSLCTQTDIRYSSASPADYVEAQLTCLQPWSRSTFARLSANYQAGICRNSPKMRYSKRRMTRTSGTSRNSLWSRVILAVAIPFCLLIQSLITLLHSLRNRPDGISVQTDRQGADAVTYGDSRVK